MANAAYCGAIHHAEFLTRTEKSRTRHILCVELTIYPIIVVKRSYLPEDQQAGSRFPLVVLRPNACSLR
jgi:hypothetical protein